MDHADILKKATGKNLIYKYVKFDSSRPGFLQTELYRFTQPNELNDPFEALPRVLINKQAPENYEIARARAIADGGYNLSQEEIERFYLKPAISYRFDEKTAPTLWPAHLPELRVEPFQSIEELDRFQAHKASSEFIERASRSMGIFCLTQEPHSLLMWAHYADEHKGMLLAFDQEHFFFKKGNGLHEVEYREERISVTSNNGMLYFCGHRVKESLPMILRAFMRKHPIWKYEAEVRMVLPLDECDEYISDENQPIYLFHIPARALCAIVLGARISEPVAKFIRRLLARDYRWKHVKLFKAELNDQDMMLDYL